jgi:hypothetical protein
MQHMKFHGSILSAVILTASVALAQEGAARTQFIRQQEAQSGIYAKSSWTKQGSTMLFALPTFFSGALSEHMGLDGSVVPALGFRGADQSVLARIANTRLRASYNFRNLLLATLGVRVPTGFNRFSDGQLNTQGNLAARQLNFQNGYLFNTLDVCAGLASSLGFADLGIGDLSFGAGLSYLFKGAFQPAKQPGEVFDPGDEFNLSFAAEYAMLVGDRHATAKCDLGFTYFGEDHYTDTVKAGAKFNWAIEGSMPITPMVPISLRIANFLKGVTRDRYGETGKGTNDLIIASTCGIPFASDYAPYAKLMMGGYSGGFFDKAANALIFTLGGGGSKRINQQLSARTELGLDMGAVGGGGIFGVELQGAMTYAF